MQLTETDRLAMLRRWIAPPTAAETERLERAKRMVQGAINSHGAFNGVDHTVEAKGSFANNTNVRYDSDVDIMVQINDPYHYEPSIWSWYNQSSYNGPWTPEYLRKQVSQALQSTFGNIDKTHNVAFYVPEVTGSRPSTDVVPCFAYRQYRTGSRTHWDEGSVVYTQSGDKIINWPRQQLSNGRTKNVRTSQRYKFAVRSLKAVENDLAKAGTIKPLPSYFMECLIYNVPNEILLIGSLDEAFRGALAYLGTEVDMWWGNWKSLVEPNEMKKIFQEGQKWSIQDARHLLKEAWRFLNYR